MPTSKKRINLTVPDDLYQRIRTYMQKNSIESAAAACLMLVSKQLTSEEQLEGILTVIRNTNMEQLLQISQEGFDFVKSTKG